MRENGPMLRILQIGEHQLSKTLAVLAVVSLAQILSTNAAKASNVPQLQHIIIIMQENRSFDSYFGTYPGANGIPMKNGHPNDCNPDPMTHQCVYSYHDHVEKTYGGPHDKIGRASC